MSRFSTICLAVFMGWLSSVANDDITLLDPEHSPTWTSSKLRPMPKPTGERVVLVNDNEGLRSAINQGKPGDVITLKPGIYQGGIRITTSGTAGAPIHITAQQPGTVTITNGRTLITSSTQLTQEGDLWSTPCPTPVSHVSVDDRDLQPFSTVEYLKQRVLLEKGKPGKPGVAPPEGFVWSKGTLYMNLLMPDKPETIKVVHSANLQTSNTKLHASIDKSWHPEYTSVIESNLDQMLFQVEGSHIHFHGLRFDMAPAVGIFVGKEAHHVQIHDCLFQSCVKGVIVNGANDFLIEHSEWHLFPRFQWARWAETVQGSWKAAWGSALPACFVEHHGLRHRVINNHAYEGWDIARPRYAKSDRAEDMSEYAYNVFRSAADECIEFDSKPTLNLRVHHNVLMDAVMPLAISPVLKGKLLIDHNIVYQSTIGLKNCGLIKWYMIPSWKRFKLPTSGVTIVHNTMLNPNKEFVWTGEDHTFNDILIDNNIFRVWQASHWNYSGMTLSPNNLYRGTINKMDHLQHTLRKVEPGFVKAPNFPSKPMVQPFEGFNAKPKPVNHLIDFHLAPTSACIDAGSRGNDLSYGHASHGESADLGALEFGSRWEFPRPGPRWLKKSPVISHSPLPPEIHPRWVGLD